MRKPPPSQPTALLAANRGWALWSSRRGIVEGLLAAGWRVIVATAADEWAQKLAELGADLVEVRFARSGLSPRADAAALRAMVKLLRQERPGLMHLFHAKPMLLGGLAARWVRPRKVAGKEPGKEAEKRVLVGTVTGLGQAFERSALARQLALAGYRVSLPAYDAVVFQNPDDRDFFLQRRLLTSQQARLIVSSGVDLERFRLPADPELDQRRHRERPRVLMVARWLKSKGVEEFLEAARQLKERFPQARFQLAGERDEHHPESVPEAVLSRASAEGVVEILGYRRQLELDLAETSIFVLPSYYREGVPRTALEAAACGAALVVADAPGTRETVEEGVTGLRVPPRDSGALAQALGQLLADEELRRQFGTAGRRRIEESFDLRDILRRQLDLYGELGARPSP
ncbi:MAG: glycosyltransferase family 4 protein [Acidobacteriota bacterium]